MSILNALVLRCDFAHCQSRLTLYDKVGRRKLEQRAEDERWLRWRYGRSHFCPKCRGRAVRFLTHGMFYPVGHPTILRLAARRAYAADHRARLQYGHVAAGLTRRVIFSGIPGGNRSV